MLSFFFRPIKQNLFFVFYSTTSPDIISGYTSVQRHSGGPNFSNHFISIGSEYTQTVNTKNKKNKHSPHFKLFYSLLLDIRFRFLCSKQMSKRVKTGSHRLCWHWTRLRTFLSGDATSSCVYQRVHTHELDQALLYCCFFYFFTAQKNMFGTMCSVWPLFYFIFLRKVKYI